MMLRRPILSVLLALALATAPAAASEVATLIERGQLRRAETLLLPRTGAASRDVEALHQLALIRVEQEREDEAVALAERAVKLAPQDAASHRALAAAIGSKLNRSGALSAFGAARRFKKEAEEALRLDPSSAEVIEWLVEFHRRAPGIVGGDKKRVPVLEAQLMQVDARRAHLRLAGSALRERDSIRALQHYEKALAAEASGTRAHLQFASYLSARYRDPARAERLAQAALEREPWRMGAWAVLASLQARDGRYGEMEQTLSRSEQAVPGWLGASYQCARVLVSLRQELPRAERLLRRYLSAPPEYGEPTHASARWRLAQALEHQGRKAEAVAELEAVLKTQPDHADAKKDLKRLRG
jgi:tetratricopeptide (TPR) repeat protein